MWNDDWLSKLNKGLTWVALIAIAFLIVKFDLNSDNETTAVNSSVEKVSKEPEVSKENTEAGSQKTFINVKEIAGKSQFEVNKVLGKPLKQEKFDFEMGPEFTASPVTMNYYLEMLEGDMGRVEIMFVDGGAQRIQVNLIGKEYYKDKERTKNLAYVGLPVVDLDPPVNEVQKVSFKENVFGFHRVTAADWLGTENGNVEIITKRAYE